MEEVAHLKVHWMMVLIVWVVMSNFLFVGQGSCRKRVPERELNVISLYVGFQNSKENDPHRT